MVLFCVVHTCKHHSQTRNRPDDPNLSFQIFPSAKKEAKLREQWFSVIKAKAKFRASTWRSARLHVCSEHFASSDFERDLMSELLGLNRPKKLKKDAVPWLFLPEEEADDEDSNSNENGTAEDESDSRKETNPSGVQMEKKRNATAKISKDHTVVGGRNLRSSGNQVVGNGNEKPTKLGCLICSKSPVAKDYATKRVHPGAANVEPLNRQLWNIFVLRNLLEVPSYTCKELLESFGKKFHPNSWFQLCGQCAESVKQAMEIDEQLLGLNLKIKSVKNRIQRKLVDSLKQRKDEELKKNEIEVKIRSILRDKNQVSPVVVIKIEPEDDDISVLAEKPYSVKDALSAKIDNLLKQNASVLASSIEIPKVEEEKGISNERQKTKTQESQSRVLVVQRMPIYLTVPDNGHDSSNSPTNASGDSVPRRRWNILRQAVNPKKITQPLVKHSDVFKCKICPAVFANNALHLKHVAEHKKSDAMNNCFDCSFCRFPCNDERFLKNHLQRQHHNQSSNSPEKSEANRKRKRKDPMLKSTMLEVAKDVLVLPADCPHCTQSFKNSNQMKKHVKQKHEDKLKNVCDICGFTVSKALERKWKTHILNHKLDECSRQESGKFGCTLCKENFDTKCRLRRHKRKQHAKELGLDPYLCPECGRTFSSNATLESHIKIQHNEDNLFVCELCGIRLSSKISLQVHLKQHGDPKEYKCDRCGADFNSMANLKEHQKKYYGIGKKSEGVEPIAKRRKRQPQQCRHCKITLPHKGALRRHLRTHSILKCNICGNSYSNQASLYKHKRFVHSGLEPKACCPYCNKEFRHKMSVYGHYQYCKAIPKADSMPGGEDIRCEICNRSFRHKMGLYGHFHDCKRKKLDDDCDEVRNNETDHK
ncbi:unnamed protein product [Orchesella dallaii]|uniref:Zinc finger protein n=1 Tax=Orchesella dallaii TaxID=48710 RepID=A0ABP1QEL1_9HEXA